MSDEPRTFPVAGGGTVTHLPTVDHPDGRRTMGSMHYGPEGDFLGITQMDLTPRKFDMSPAAQIAAGLRLIRERYGQPRPWATYRGATYMDDTDDSADERDPADTIRLLKADLRGAAEQAGAELLKASCEGRAREAAEWATAAHHAMLALERAALASPAPAPTAVEGGLRHAVAAYEDFLDQLARRFESQEASDGALRIAREIRGTLDGVQGGRP